MRRLIQIKDGHPETVEIWLAFLKKHAYYGIGMKANVWEYNKIGKLSLIVGSSQYIVLTSFTDVGKEMDASMEEMKGVMESEWEKFGRKEGSETAEKVMEILNRENFKTASGGNAPMMKPSKGRSPVPIREADTRRF